MAFLSCLLSFSLTEMMHYPTKTQLDEPCFLAQLLSIHQTLFQPFISSKFCSLPKEGTLRSSSSSPTPTAGAELLHTGSRREGETLLLLPFPPADPGFVRPPAPVFPQHSPGQSLPIPLSANQTLETWSCPQPTGKGGRQGSQGGSQQGTLPPTNSHVPKKAPVLLCPQAWASGADPALNTELHRPEQANKTFPKLHHKITQRQNTTESQPVSAAFELFKKYLGNNSLLSPEHTCACGSSTFSNPCAQVCN